MKTQTNAFMAPSTGSTRASRSKIQASSPTRVKGHSLNAHHHHQVTTGSCTKCSGLIIHEHVIGIDFSGFVMRCVNCGATEYLTIGPW